MVKEEKSQRRQAKKSQRRQAKKDLKESQVKSQAKNLKNQVRNI